MSYGLWFWKHGRPEKLLLLCVPNEKSFNTHLSHSCMIHSWQWCVVSTLIIFWNKGQDICHNMTNKNCWFTHNMCPNKDLTRCLEKADFAKEVPVLCNAGAALLTYWLCAGTKICWEWSGALSGAWCLNLLLRVEEGRMSLFAVQAFIGPKELCNIRSP